MNAKPTSGKWVLTCQDTKHDDHFTERKWLITSPDANSIVNAEGLICGAALSQPQTKPDTTSEVENNLNLIVALQNAAVSINPPNPMAVAEGMKKVVRALGLAIILCESATASRGDLMEVPSEKIGALLFATKAALDAMRAKPKGETK